MTAPLTWRAGPTPVSVVPVEYEAPALEKRSVRAKSSFASRTVYPIPRSPIAGMSLATTTSRPMSGILSGRNNTVSTVLTTATLAPIASASVATVVAVNVGDRRSARRACRISLGTL